MIKYTSNILFPSTNLPFTLISLEDWIPIVVSGEDSIKYLQNQFTCNLFHIKNSQYSFSAHCNELGQTISNICLFYYQNNLIYLIRRSVHQLQLQELKKYAVFSKINIFIKPNLILLGLAGINARFFLKTIFGNLPNKISPVMHYDKISLIYFSLPKERYILVTNYKMYKYLLQKLPSEIKFNNSLQWLALDIESGYPLIDKINSMKFIPQAINLKNLGGIDFKKGCYLGQEIICRTEYKKINNLNLFWLEGQEGQNNFNLNPGECLTICNNYNIFKTGTVLASCKLINNKIWIQAILNKKLLLNNIIKINSNSKNSLIIKKIN